MTSESVHCVSYTNGQLLSNSNIPKIKVKLLFNKIKRVLYTGALVDSGSDNCMVSVDDLSDELKSTIEPCSISIGGINTNAPTKSIGQIKVDLELDEKVRFPDVPFIVMPTKIPMLIGQNILSNHRVKSYEVTKHEVILKMSDGQVNSLSTKRSMPGQHTRSFFTLPTFTSLDQKLKWISETLCFA